MHNIMTRTRVVTIVAACSFCLLVFWIVRGSKTTIKTRQWTGAIPPPSPPPPSPPPSRFLYLLQTESCLPDKLRSIEAFGDSTACQCDVLVLSYILTCSDPPPAHVEYISASSPTSWSEGRNLLFRAAMRRSEKYLYYIVMDDDIVLKAKAETTENPWRVFENFLSRIEPAVAALDTTTHLCVAQTYRARKSRGCSLNGAQEYIPAVRYDACFNAFHYQAVNYILPYRLDFDNTSWYLSEWYSVIKSKVTFPGQAVLHTGLVAYNPVHRSYPKKSASDQDLQFIVKLVQADLPERYRNASLLLEWKEYGMQHELKSSVTCLPPPPPKMPIKPFAYIESHDTRIRMVSLILWYGEEFPPAI